MTKAPSFCTFQQTLERAWWCLGGFWDIGSIRYHGQHWISLELNARLERKRVLLSF